MAEPWDDSALINAFNSAIAKYKTMHGIAVKDKAPSQDVTENVINMESDNHAVAHGVEHSELSQKEENGGVPPLQADKLSSHEEGHTGKNIVEDGPAGYNGYADPQFYAQQHGHSATAENCYLCQYKAYYNQTGAWTSSAAPGLNGLQCQYCGGVPPLQADKLSSHAEGHTGKNEVPAGYNGYADPQYCAQQHGHSATAENCYLCQYKAYYNQTGVWTSPAAPGLNVLQCQYCGYANQHENGTKNQPQASQTSPDASAFPDIVKAAIAEALKTADGQNPTGVMTENSQTHSSFSDVAVAWFLAGFHTSRYLSQSK